MFPYIKSFRAAVGRGERLGLRRLRELIDLHETLIARSTLLAASGDVPHIHIPPRPPGTSKHANAAATLAHFSFVFIAHGFSEPVTHGAKC